MGERVAIAALLALALLAGCAGQSQRAEATGFLAGAELVADAADANALVYWSRQAELRDYDGIIVAPVEVSLGGRQRTQSPSDEAIGALTQMLESALIEALSPAWRVGGAPGAGTLRLRVVITDLRPSTPEWNVHPATKLLGFGLGGASVETELVDSVTGVRVAAFVDARAASKEIGSGLTRWADAHSALEAWAGLLAQRLEARRAGVAGR